MEERNPNEVTTFPYAKKDREMKLRTALLFFMTALVLFTALFLVDLLFERKMMMDHKTIFKPVFITIVYYLVSHFVRIRRYNVDYQNAIIINMGCSSEIISMTAL